MEKEKKKIKHTSTRRKMMLDKKKRGFTLVEIIAVIIIIGIIALVAIPAVLSYLNNANDQTYSSHESAMVSAAKSYNADCISSNGSDCFLPSDTENILKLEELEYKSYIDELKDPETHDVCDKNSYVYIYNDGAGKYDYTACLACGEYKTKNPVCTCLDDPDADLCKSKDRPVCGERVGANISSSGRSLEKKWTNVASIYKVQCKKANGSTYECGNKEENYWFSKEIRSSSADGFSSIEIYYEKEDGSKITNQCRVEAFVDTIPPTCTLNGDSNGNVTITGTDEGGSGLDEDSFNYSPDHDAEVRSETVEVTDSNGNVSTYNKIYTLYRGEVLDNAGNKGICSSYVESPVLSYELDPAPDETDGTEIEWKGELTEEQIDEYGVPNVEELCTNIILADDGTYTTTQHCKPSKCDGDIEFLGWYYGYDKNANRPGVKISSTDGLKSYAHHTLYAKWKGKTYTITFKVNGKSHTITCNLGTPCEIPTTDDLKNAFGDFSKNSNGGVFLGWRVTYSGDDTSTGKILSATDEYYDPLCDGENVNFYPIYGTNLACRQRTITKKCKWEEESKCSGWNSKYACDTCYHGGSSKGWCIKEKVYKCTKSYGPWSNWIPNSLNTSSTATLDVQCTDTVYNATYVSNPGDECHDDFTGVQPGAKIGTLCTPTKTGYTFNGWYMEDSFDTKITANSVVNVSGNFKLYAKFTPDPYNVYFCLPDKTCTTGKNNTKKSCTYDADCSLIYANSNASKYVKKGYDLIGWKLEDSDTVYELGETKPFNFVSKLLYPVYKANGYTVKYIDNPTDTQYTSAVVTNSCESAVTNMEDGDTLTDLCIPHSSNYAFGGWYTGKKKTGTLYTNTSVFNSAATAGINQTTKELTLYAYWVNQVSLNYDLNGGSKSGCSSVTKLTYGTTVSDAIKGKFCGDASFATKPPTRSGYDFDGFYDKPEGDETARKIDLINYNPKIEVPTFTLYAHWRPKTLQVEYNYNLKEGSNITEGCDSTFNVVYNSPYGDLYDDGLCIPEVDSSDVFLGWYTKAKDGTEVSNETIYDNINQKIIYAHWGKGLKVAFKGNTATSGSCKTKTFPTETTSNLGAIIDYCSGFKKTGHHIVGWCTSASCNSSEYLDRNMSLETFIQNVNDSKTNTTFYPQWEPTVYKITYSNTVDGGICNLNQRQITYGTKYQYFCKPYLDADNSNTGPLFNDGDIVTYTDKKTYTLKITESGGNKIYNLYNTGNNTLFKANVPITDLAYSPHLNANDLRNATDSTDGTFAGWYLESSYKNKVTEATVFNKASDITLYAKWTDVVNVTLIPYSGAATSSKKVSFKYTFGKSTSNKKALLPVPKRSGYSFVGWYTEEEGGIKVEDSTPVKSIAKLPSLTLYAHWESLEFSVTLVNSAGKKICNDKKFDGVLYPKKIYGSVYGNLCDEIFTSDDITRDAETGMLISKTTNTAFVSWSTNKDSNSYKYFVNETTPISISKDHNLYAKWGKVLTVTLNPNGADALGGNCTSNTLKVVQYGFFSRLCTPAREGYAFDGWYTKAKNGTKRKKQDQVTNDKDFTLYAHWKVCTGGVCGGEDDV